MNLAINKHVYVHVNNIWQGRLGVFRIIQDGKMWRIILHQMMDEYTTSFQSLPLIEKIELLYCHSKAPNSGDPHFAGFLNCKRRRYWISHPVVTDPGEFALLYEWAEYETPFGSIDSLQIKL